jgi:hypothetical protein
MSSDEQKDAGCYQEGVNGVHREKLEDGERSVIRTDLSQRGFMRNETQSFFSVLTFSLD